MLQNVVRVISREGLLRSSSCVMAASIRPLPLSCMEKVTGWKRAARWKGVDIVAVRRGGMGSVCARARAADGPDDDCDSPRTIRPLVVIATPPRACQGSDGDCDSPRACQGSDGDRDT
eukprot:3758040-Pleurochrysis_carterae.AAC.1